MIILNKVFYFNAAHQYGNPSMTEAENLSVFGKDVRVHGHNYELTVSVTGDVNPATGFIADLGHLKDVVSLIEKDIPWFKGKQPSTENMVVWIWESIEKHLESCTLHRVRLKETPTIYTDYYGPSAK